eukprot:c12060_g1_i1.p1 GENE.c12060_g1_i1~~c12060_g1_i1.p1  ORF type:complete len:413 (-),score=73.54 c12060_g1_i1:23-1219(-)
MDHDAADEVVPLLPPPPGPATPVPPRTPDPTATATGADAPAAAPIEAAPVSTKKAKKGKKGKKKSASSDDSGDDLVPGLGALIANVSASAAAAVAAAPPAAATLPTGAPATAAPATAALATAAPTTAAAASTAPNALPLGSPTPFSINGPSGPAPTGAGVFGAGAAAAAADEDDEDDGKKKGGKKAKKLKKELEDLQMRAVFLVNSLTDSRTVISNEVLPHLDALRDTLGMPKMGRALQGPARTLGADLEMAMDAAPPLSLAELKAQAKDAKVLAKAQAKMAIRNNEPRTLFSNERTALSWANASLKLGGIGTALITFFAHEWVPLLIGTGLWVIALAYLIYAGIRYRQRAVALATGKPGPFLDLHGPVSFVVFICIAVSIYIVFFLAFSPQARVSNA